MSLQRIKEGCHIDELTGCWIWMGALSAGRYPRVHAANLSKGGAMQVQTGARAVWQAHTGKPIPEGHRVYHPKCTNERCICPQHLACGPTTDWGKALSKQGKWKGQATRIRANRSTGRKRSHISLTMLQEIQASDETSRAMATRMGLSESVLSNARRGKLKSLQELGNPFAGLMG